MNWTLGKGASPWWLALGCVALHGVLLTSCIAPPDKNGEAKGKTDPESASQDADGASSRVATAPANGWGEQIAWRNLDEGRQEAAELDRPLMLVVWTTWCGNCRALKKRFAADKTIRELSEQFVMVNVDQDREPSVAGLGPDGSYIPRVLFLDQKGEVDGLLFNQKRNRSRYFYSPRDDVAAKMQEALDRHAKS